MCRDCEALTGALSALTKENERLNVRIDDMFVQQALLERKVEQLRTENAHLSMQYHRALFPPAAVVAKPVYVKPKPVPKVVVTETQANIITAFFCRRRNMIPILLLALLFAVPAAAQTSGCMPTTCQCTDARYCR